MANVPPQQQPQKNPNEGGTEGVTIPIGGVIVKFPFSPYASQKAMMAMVSANSLACPSLLAIAIHSSWCEMQLGL